ncbi:MAG: CBS domain-containing protein [Archangiaceae bacterium]|nr:CBS domain-containing protein [Archangiaceae bacterium]
MNLARFCEGRLVVLRPTATAAEAARAMENNHIGAVLVMDHSRLRGIVTDRDLALKIVASNFKPSRLPLSEVMTRDPVTLEKTDTVEQAVAMMHAMHVRRVVVMEGQRPVGIVTLDDLILSNAVPQHRVREVIFGQLSDAAPAKPEGFTGPRRLGRRRSTAEERSGQRRRRSLRAFTDHVKQVTGLEGDSEARAAFEVVATGLLRRLTQNERADFLAQLPALVREPLQVNSRGAPDRTVSRRTIERDLQARLKVPARRAAALVTRMGGAMGEFVSEGELADVKAQLPASMKPLLHPHAA